MRNSDAPELIYVATEEARRRNEDRLQVTTCLPSGSWCWLKVSWVHRLNVSVEWSNVHWATVGGNVFTVIQFSQISFVIDFEREWCSYLPFMSVSESQSWNTSVNSWNATNADQTLVEANQRRCTPWVADDHTAQTMSQWQAQTMSCQRQAQSMTQTKTAQTKSMWCAQINQGRSPCSYWSPSVCHIDGLHCTGACVGGQSQHDYSNDELQLKHKIEYEVCE